jgi:hypothetical protein
MYYKVQVSLYQDFHELVINDIVETVAYDTFSNLEYYTTYYWRVKSIEPQYGNESEWSSTCTFVTRPEDTIINQTSADNSIVFVCNNNSVYPPNCILQNGTIGNLLSSACTNPSALGYGVRCNSLLTREE